MVNFSMNSCTTVNISFVLPSFRGGGAEKVVITLANYLSKDYRVALIVLENDGELKKSVDDSVNMHILDVSRARYAIFGLPKKIREINPDIVVGAVEQVTMLLGVMKLFLPSKTIVINRVENSYNKITSGLNWFLRKLFASSLKLSDHVISVSHAVKGTLLENTNINEDKITTIYNPVDVERVRRLSKQSVDHKAFKHTPVLLGCGRLEKQKGFRYLIDALPKIKEEYQDAQIVLLGKGSLKEKLQTQAGELGVAASVHFPGFVDNPYKYMRAADTFVLPSLFEGLGNVTIEAMASGIPIVATRSGGTLEILEEGKWGKMIPCRDSNAIAEAVMGVLKNEKSRKEEQMLRAEDFRPEKVVNEYKNLILELIDIMVK